MPKLSDPNDGFLVWNRWLGTNRYEAHAELSQEAVVDMRHFFRAWTQTFGLPFLNKNNRNTMCINLLAEALPEAHFVVVRRDPVYVAQSLIHARQSIQGDKRAKWGLKSRDVHSAREPLGYIDDICDQLIEIEVRLRTQLEQVAPSRIHAIQYETFCSQPEEFLESLCESIPGIYLNRKAMDTQISEFEASKRLSVSDEELKRIRNRFAEVRMCV